MPLELQPDLSMVVEYDQQGHPEVGIGFKLIRRVSHSSIDPLLQRHVANAEHTRFRGPEDRRLLEGLHLRDGVSSIGKGDEEVGLLTAVRNPREDPVLWLERAGALTEQPLEPPQRDGVAFNPTPPALLTATN